MPPGGRAYIDAGQRARQRRGGPGPDAHRRGDVRLALAVDLDLARDRLEPPAEIEAGRIDRGERERRGGVGPDERERAARPRARGARGARAAPVEDVGVPGQGVAGRERRRPHRPGIGGGRGEVVRVRAIVLERHVMHARAVRCHVRERDPGVDELGPRAIEPLRPAPVGRPAGAARRDLPGPDVLDEHVPGAEHGLDARADGLADRPELVEGVHEHRREIGGPERTDRADGAAGDRGGGDLAERGPAGRGVPGGRGVPCARTGRARPDREPFAEGEEHRARIARAKRIDRIFHRSRRG